MTPAVTAILAIPEGVAHPTCTSCLGGLADIALRCNTCKTYVHLRCSGMPEYQLARLSISQAHYLCTICVKAKDFEENAVKYDAECTKIQEVFAKELSIIERTDDDANRTQIEEREQNVEIVSHPKTSKICFRFINRNCKFGPKGEGCRFDHPKICRFFARMGERRGGCKKGEKCKFVHPKLCWLTTGGHECNRKNCHFLHPYGLKVHQDGKEDTSMENPGQAQSYKSRFDPVKNRGGSNEKNSQRQGVAWSTRDSNQENRPEQTEGNRSTQVNFLDIRELLEAQHQMMRQMQQQMMSLMREKMVPFRGKVDSDPLASYQPRW